MYPGMYSIHVEGVLNKQGFSQIDKLYQSFHVLLFCRENSYSLAKFYLLDS